MSLAVIQMASQADVALNLVRARELLEQAAEAGDGPILPWLKQAARDLRLWIVAGTLPLPPDDDPQGKPNACSLLFDDQGQRVARYDKLHLFDADVTDNRGHYRESDDYAAGQRLVIADTPIGRLGLSVCYDLRFAELYGALRAAGAELISVPSAFTTVTGEAHWATLIRARAIETQCYILAAAQGGEHPGGRLTHGHSSIVDPWGRLLCEQATGEAALVAARDATEQAAIRQRMPLQRHRRFSVPCLATDRLE